MINAHEITLSGNGFHCKISHLFHCILCQFFYTDTSRQPKEGEENGKGYHFVSREEMDTDIRAGKYLEHGDYEGNLYGTKVDSIRDVMRSGKMCLLDVNPTVSQLQT